MKKIGSGRQEDRGGSYCWYTYSINIDQTHTLLTRPMLRMQTGVSCHTLWLLLGAEPLKESCVYWGKEW